MSVFGQEAVEEIKSIVKSCFDEVTKSEKQEAIKLIEEKLSKLVADEVSNYFRKISTYVLYGEIVNKLEEKK
jgi:hypothetical protein